MADLSPQIADSGEHDYLAGRAMAQRAAVDQQWQSLVGAPPAKAAQSAPATPAAANDEVTAPPFDNDLPIGQRMISAAALGHGIAATASDVGRGIIDAPRQAIGGALDLVNNIVNFSDTVVKKAEEAGLPNVYPQIFDENGKFDPRLRSAEEFRKAEAEGKDHILQVPTTGQPDTITGQLVRTAVPFIMGRGTSGSALGKIGGTLPGELARDFVSGAVSQDPETPRLSNVIDQVAPNAVTDFLKAKPGDEGTVLGRVKSGLEFAGLGAAVGGAVRALKAFKASMPEGDLASLGEGAPQGAAEAAGAGEAAPAATPGAATAEPAAGAAQAGPARDILRIGDPLEPAVVIRPTARDAAMAEVTADRLALNNEPSALGEPANPAEIPVTEGAVPHETVPPEPQRLASFLVGKGGLQDQGGEVSYVTGDTRARPGLISGKGMTLDDAAHDAWEAGFLPGAERPTTDALIDALADDLRGNPQYRAGDADAAAKFSEAVDRNSELDQIGDAHGIPTRNITRDDFFNAYADRLSQEAPGQEPLLQPGNDQEFAAAQQRTRTAYTDMLEQARASRPAPEPSIMSEQTIHDYLSGARVDNPVKINLQRIGSPEDIGDALAQVSRTIPAQAVQSNDATIAAADALGMQPAEFLNGYKGMNLNAAETTAMRFMLDSSASQLIDYAKAARDPLASTEAKAQFLRAFTVHRSLQSYFENARAEAGRTLQAWSIMSQQRSDMSKAIGDMVRSAEGASGDLGELAEKVATLDNPLQAGRFVAGSMMGNGRDLLLKVWYNALLSSPTTVVKKLMSDVGMATWNVATTALAEKFGSGAVPAGETGELLAGYAGSFKDAVRAGWKALKAGESQFYRDYSTWEGQPGSVSDQVARRFSTSSAWNGSPEVLSPEEPTRGAFEYIRSFMPTSWIAGADDFAKVWNYRAELRRLAWRASDGDGDTFGRMMDNPTPQLNQQALGAALKNTFQEPLGPLGQSLANVVDAVSFQIPHTNFELPLGRLVAPFTKVPFNIAKTAAENSPLALLMREPQAVLSGGPSAARDLMVAKIGLGTGVSLSLADLALNNYLTGKGPTDPSLRAEWVRAGNQPYSLQIPGLAPVRLNQIEPFGMTLGTIADTFNILKFSEDEKDFGSLVPSLALGIGNAMLSKTYFEGIARMMDAIEHPEQQGDRWAEGFVSGFAPQLLSRLGRSMDDWERAHYGYIDSIEEKLPFLRNGLPPQRTLWGDPVPIREGFMPLLSGARVARVISPMQLGQPPESVEPIDRWVWDNRSAFALTKQGDPRGIQKVGRTQVFGQGPVTVSAQLSPEAYDRMQVLAGNELKDPRTGMGAKDTLNALVQGRFPVASEQREWSDATPALRAEIVQHTVARYRAAAKSQLLSENRELNAAVTDGLNARASALKPGSAPQ